MEPNFGRCCNRWKANASDRLRKIVKFFQRFTVSKTGLPPTTKSQKQTRCEGASLYRLVAAAISATTTTTAGAVVTRELAARAASFHRTGFIHRQLAAIMGLAMEGFDGLLAFRGSAHGHEPEAARALGVAVKHQHSVGHRAVLGEEIA